MPQPNTYPAMQVQPVDVLSPYLGLQQNRRSNALVQLQQSRETQEAERKREIQNQLGELDVMPSDGIQKRTRTMNRLFALDPQVAQGVAQQQQIGDAEQQKARQMAGLLAAKAKASVDPRGFVASAIQSPAYQEILAAAGFDPSRIDVNSPSFERDLDVWANLAPQAKPIEVSPGASLVRETPAGGFESAFTAPAKPGDEKSPFANINPADYTRESIARFQQSGNYGDLVRNDKPDAGAQFDTATKLRTEFNQQSKEFRGVADSYQRIIDSASNPSAAGDLALIFNYMKVLDPGSTVREGEFATAQNATGVPGRIVSLYNNIISGERLNTEQREDFVGRATKLYKGQETRFKTSVLDRYEALARKQGIDPRDVLVDVSAQTPQAASGIPDAQGDGPVRVNTPDEAMQLPPGTQFMTPDGRLKVRP